jgi:hypothetical protein
MKWWMWWAVIDPRGFSSAFTSVAGCMVLLVMGIVISYWLTVTELMLILIGLVLLMIARRLPS